MYITQGLEINTSLKAGNGYPIGARFTVNALGNVVAFGTTECYNGITSYRNVACSSEVASNIYNKTDLIP